MVNNLPVQKNLPALRLVDFSYLVLFFLQLSWNTEEYFLGQSDAYIPLNFAFRANGIQGKDLQVRATILQKYIWRRLIKRACIENALFCMSE